MPSSSQWKTMALPLAIVLFEGLILVMEVESSLLSTMDRINQLPGQPQVSFEQYSGYVTVDDKKQRALFYYFVEAEIDPPSKPLVLWLNGGPGCSSLGVGAFSENGPFRPSGKVLVRNGYSWNRARDNLVFLHRWFAKFPQYRNRSLFITGESYAGHYVPQLAELIIQFNKKDKLFNLKGIALGNPVLEFATDFNSRAEFFWSHGLISDSTYKLFTSTCNYSRYVSEYYRGSVSPTCSRVMSLIRIETSRYVDKYDVTLDVCISSVLSQSKVLTPQQVAETVDVCVEDETVSYLNRRDVQNALHARLIGVKRWLVCSNILDYELLDLEIPTISIVRKLIKSGIPSAGLQWRSRFCYPIDWKSNVGSWTSRRDRDDNHGALQSLVGGWTQVYDDVLSFATIRGASHEAPFSQPERSLVLFKAFLEGRPLPEAF
ncbi:hypothetical protein HYC85_025967 [Camellia sinensis]|uniref:Carboxypeptidase n=1 Tax=Camellia sinensis TaxID=4442 RepID=A0A7J7G5H1_CAMSI|nr:hypothetical protein HYC85_025967 [Camellia sinensis]